MTIRSTLIAAIVVGLSPFLLPVSGTFAQTAAKDADTASPSPPDAELYFIEPHDGASVKSPVRVLFGLRNMGVAPAGVTFEGAGHHHLLIDVREPLDLKEAIPSDRNHLHYGLGETETTVELTPGPHTLQLVLGDANHIPFKPLVESKKIRITVVTSLAKPEAKSEPKPAAKSRKKAATKPRMHREPRPAAAAKPTRARPAAVRAAQPRPAVQRRLAPAPAPSAPAVQ